MESLEHGVKAVEETYGENMLNLTLACAMLKNLSITQSGQVFEYKLFRYFSAFEKIATIETM